METGYHFFGDLRLVPGYSANSPVPLDTSESSLYPSDKNLQTIWELTFSRFNAAILDLLLSMSDSWKVSLLGQILSAKTSTISAFQPFLFHSRMHTLHPALHIPSVKTYQLCLTTSWYTANTQPLKSITSLLRANESQRLVGEGDAECFFQHVQNRIQDEVQHATEVFSLTSWSIIRETTEGWSDLGPYITAKDFVKLSEMYRLFGRVDRQKVLCDTFRVHVTEKVKSIVKD
ncbi:hypothetical protein D9758_018827 [Tetrapyrgos nigripes]|uniref:Cullin N-terminal domain-containing protein n=1 Tax=Tetrapyrgos nigripes TaxID=182062 RepID=A0A8H5B7W3_9AGAR|nr:hypothetical protein D9758_018827 [Tetrapyrgos nigripes]